MPFEFVFENVPWFEEATRAKAELRAYQMASDELETFHHAIDCGVIFLIDSPIEEENLSMFKLL